MMRPVLQFFDFFVSLRVFLFAGYFVKNFKPKMNLKFQCTHIHSHTIYLYVRHTVTGENLKTQQAGIVISL